MNFSTETKVKDIALLNPATRQVLEDAGLDYCCGGGKSLDEACLHAGVSSHEILNRIRENSRKITPEDQNWIAMPLSHLTRHIREKHHQFVREAIRRAQPLLGKVVSKHGTNHPELGEIGRLFTEVSREMTMHMQKEEQILFPYIDALERAASTYEPVEPPFFQTVKNPIHTMMKEHDVAGELVKQIRRLTSDYTAPAGACTSFKAVYEDLHGFESDLHQHVHLENNVLFPRAVKMETAAHKRRAFAEEGMVRFDEAHKAVHYPSDRRFGIWIRPSILIGIGCVIVGVIAAAWIEVAVIGMPAVAPVPQIYPNNFSGPHGFPVWVRYCHFFNFLFVMMLIRSGLSILMDHPRLYFNDGCTPGSEWLRFTPLKVPRDRLWTAKDDARYISPLVGTPGYRHTIGIARVWHFIDVHGFIITGIIFISMLFQTEQWRRIVPTSPLVLLQAWNTWVHYATFHLPPEPNGFYGYNALQQIAYFTVVFVFGPLAIATGIAMSPAVVNRFPWYARLFGGRQSARSIHFLTMFSFLAFLVVHVTLIVMTGFARNMNHIVMGTDDQSHLGMYLGFVGITVVVLTWVIAHYVSWHHPRGLQQTLKSVTYPMQLLTLNRLAPQQKYSQAQISPYFWPNGKLPVRQDWKELAEAQFQNFRLKVGGLVERPVELSLAELERFGEVEHITMHHCIQGWSGIAKWGGVPMKAIIDLVKPKPEARVVAFFSFGPALYGGAYYDTQSLENVLKPQCLLASRMNGQRLPLVYGAPLRLRVENQLGYKMVKWIERIEFVESEKTLGKGEGGKNEDDEYFDLLPNI